MTSTCYSEVSSRTLTTPPPKHQGFCNNFLKNSHIYTCNTSRETPLPSMYLMAEQTLRNVLCFLTLSLLTVPSRKVINIPKLQTGLKLCITQGVTLQRVKETRILGKSSEASTSLHFQQSSLTKSIINVCE